MARYPFLYNKPPENLSSGVPSPILPSFKNDVLESVNTGLPKPNLKQEATSSFIMQPKPERMLGMLEFGMERLLQSKTDRELAALLEAWTHCVKTKNLVFHTLPTRELSGELTEAHLSLGEKTAASQHSSLQNFAGEYQLYSSKSRSDKDRSYWAHRLDQQGSFFFGKRDTIRAVCFEYINAESQPLISIHPLIILKARQFITMLSQSAPAPTGRLLPISFS